jgi:hypothetical protein
MALRHDPVDYEIACCHRDCKIVWNLKGATSSVEPGRFTLLVTEGWTFTEFEHEDDDGRFDGILVQFFCPMHEP